MKLFSRARKMLKMVVSCGMIDFVSVFLSHRSKLTLARNISTVIPYQQEAYL